MQYRGRIAPTPTGYLHLGHGSTFTIAAQRAHDNNGQVIFRNEDLDQARCKDVFITASIDDLKAIGLTWSEGPDIGGPYAPYSQSERLPLYENYWKKLYKTGFIYPCKHSRKDIQNALTAPHAEDEVIFPLSLRPVSGTGSNAEVPGPANWRFRIPDGEKIAFNDGHYGHCSFEAGKDFGDFLIWRKDGMPSYEMAVVVDDHEMNISEVVRGKDLLLSTARQLLLYRALNIAPPEFYHCDLIKDENGQRLAKRNKSLSLREITKEKRWNAVKKQLNL